MRIRLALAGAVAVLAACLAIQWQAREGINIEAAPAATRGAAVRSAPPLATTVTAPGPASPVPPAPQVRWRALEDKFARARSLRAFYYEAVQRPQDGGFYYANKALGLCKIALKTPTHDTPEARQAQAALRERCDLTEQDIEDAWRHFEAIRGAGLTDDLLYRQLFGFLMAQSDGARVAALQAAVDLGNPEIAGSLLASAMAKDAPAAPPAQSEYAMLLVQCRLGADCGGDSVVAQMLCARDGWCGGSVQDALHSGLGAEFARLDGPAQRAVAALRRGELASLLPKQPAR